MIELKKLTRNFEDQCINKIEQIEDTIEITINVFEIGDNYGISNEKEDRVFDADYIDGKIKSVRKTLKLILYGVTN